MFRVAKEGSYLAVREFWRGEKLDCVVTIDPSTGARSNALKRYPAYEHKPIQLRLIKYEINSKIYVLATTILEQNIARQDFIDLYARRWQTSEETYKAFKKHLEVETFHSTTENGVKQELEVTAILWNMTRMLGSIADQVIKKKLTQCLNLSHYQIKTRQALFSVSLKLKDLLYTRGKKLQKHILEFTKYCLKTALPIRLGRHFPRISMRPPNKWSRTKVRGETCL